MKLKFTKPKSAGDDNYFVAKIYNLNWEFTIFEELDGWMATFYIPSGEDEYLNKKSLKTKEAAIECCEKHLRKIKGVLKKYD